MDKGALRGIMILSVVAALAVAARLTGLGDRLGELRAFIDGFGAWGPAVFTLIYIVAVVAALPGAAITVLAGTLFGSITGIIVVSIGSTVGAGLCFLIAKHVARDAVSRRLKGYGAFKRLLRMTEEHGAAVVALTRLVPLFPFNLLNYGFGLTRVRFRTYIFWSWLCMLPGTVVYVVGADTVARAVSEGHVPWGLAGVLACAGVGLGLLARYAGRRLKGTSDN